MKCQRLVSALALFAALGVASIPRFGEAVAEVPVTASAFRMMGQALGFMKSASRAMIRVV